MDENELDARFAAMAKRFGDDFYDVAASPSLGGADLHDLGNAVARALLYADPLFARVLTKALNSDELQPHYPLADLAASHETKRRDEQWQAPWRKDTDRSS